MKNRIFRVFAMGIIFIAFTTFAFAQNTENKANKRTDIEPVRMAKEQVPDVVIENFFKDHSSVKYELWKGYPIEDFTNVWYDYNPYLNSSSASGYFVVEFWEDGEHQEAMYSNEGKKIAVHKKLSSQLPKPILEAISRGLYRDWEIAKENEEIFRDNSLDQSKVYKIEVHYGSSKHFLFYSPDGALLKNKIIQ